MSGRGAATPTDGRSPRERPDDESLFDRVELPLELDPVDPLLELPPDDPPLDDPDRGLAVLPVLDPGGAVRCAAARAGTALSASATAKLNSL